MILDKEPIINKTATAKRIRWLMSENGVTQADILEYTGGADSTVSSWLRGDTVPSLLNLIKIAYLCDCEITDMIVLSWSKK